MNALANLYAPINNLINKVSTIEGIAPLLLRVYLAPIMILSGYNKFASFDNTAAWFGNPDWGLGLPFPELLTFLASSSELVGGIFLLLGFATKLTTIPLMMTMLVAAVTAHWSNGWHALPDATLTMPWEWRTDLIDSAVQKREAARSILREHGNYDWLTSSGSITVLKNGIEFAATYFIMLLSLFFTGGGKYTSVDYFIAKKFSTED